MGAPPTGELPWQLVQFFASTVATSHGRPVGSDLPPLPVPLAVVPPFT